MCKLIYFQDSEIHLIDLPIIRVDAMYNARVVWWGIVTLYAVVLCKHSISCIYMFCMHKSPQIRLGYLILSDLYESIECYYLFIGLNNFVKFMYEKMYICSFILENVCITVCIII